MVDGALIALAWVLTLPAAMIMAGLLYVIFRQIFDRPLERFAFGREAAWTSVPAAGGVAHRSHLGFLGSWPFGRENPRLWGLEKLGFPWILSSESRLFNGLRGILR